MTPVEPAPSSHPFVVWERRHYHWAVLCGVITLLCVGGVMSVIVGTSAWHTLLISLAPALCVGAWLTRPIRRRRAILRQPFPPAWRQVLEQDVAFYRGLGHREQERFRQELQVFIGEKRITGVALDLDERTRVLAAASAVIPIFGFPDWEWNEIGEVLIYPGRFDRRFDFDSGDERSILGMVGTGVMNRLMILSQPDLVHGFSTGMDRRNVGVHEFAHLVDKSDGQIDGVPGVGLSPGAVRPWVELVRIKMSQIRAGESDIDRYALTNEAEFFAVVSEYFFEHPDRMAVEHPELHASLERIFSQRVLGRVGAIVESPRRRLLGRNMRCPCGSGKKYKHCCR